MSFLVLCVHILLIQALPHVFMENAEVVFQWKILDFKWPNDTIQLEYLSNRRFIPQNNLIAGIKVFGGSVYVTVPRWKPGVPSTLNKVVVNSANESILEPYPNWEMQTIGNCNALQFVQSMEIDPNTGYMWIIDTGRINILNSSDQRNLCPAKLVIYDINNDRLFRKYEFPDSVVSVTSNYLDDIVIDYVNGVAAFAYITDPYDSKIVVYNHIEETSYFFQDSSMNKEPGTEVIVIGSNSITTNVNIDGLAMSPDFKYLYYSALNGYNLYKVSTKLLRNKLSTFSAEFIGRKIDLSGGIIFSNASLYFGAMSMSAVYKWTVTHSSNKTFIQDRIFLNVTTGRWPDTFGIDEHQNLWFVANGLDLFFNNKMNFSKPNMFIWKIAIGEESYLSSARARTLTHGPLEVGK